MEKVVPQASGEGTLPCYTIQGQGESLVLIMGLGGSKEAWIFQTGVFRRHYRVITFDNRGVDPTRAGQKAFTIGDMADDAIALLDHLCIDSAHILGYSLGGLVAQEIAIRYPRRVKKLILAASVAVGGESERSTAGVQKALGLGPGGTEQSMNSVNLKKVMPVLVSLAFNKWGYRTLIGLVAGSYAKRIGLEGLAGQLQAPARANTLERLGSIQATTLVLTGTKDRVVDPTASHLLASRIPRAKLVLVEGGSHAFSIEMSRRFNREVLDFLSAD